MARDSEQDAKPVIIKKYANRRLYNTDTSSYVTLEDLATMVRSERDFVVFDAKSGEDLTHAVLTQIIVEQESRGENLLPIPFLRQLIRFYGNSLQNVVPSYLEMSLNTLTKQQDQYRGHFGTAAFDLMQDQVRKNFETFEHAMGLFSPFGKNEAEAPASAPRQENGVKPQSREDGETATKERDKTGEIENLKAELSAMQERLEQLSRRSG